MYLSKVLIFLSLLTELKVFDTVSLDLETVQWKLLCTAESIPVLYLSLDLVNEGFEDEGDFRLYHTEYFSVQGNMDVVSYDVNFPWSWTSLTSLFRFG